jgi:hypothetical protein
VGGGEVGGRVDDLGVDRTELLGEQLLLTLVGGGGDAVDQVALLTHQRVLVGLAGLVDVALTLGVLGLEPPAGLPASEHEGGEEQRGDDDATDELSEVLHGCSS